ncbi:hypothetical protein SAMN05444166_0835 [Singulisphaera sp. GP187]|uniref:hypothetical protein n=1 Tax=Singulisphaera sp. GP187 TaxID=1882752 RepID=UPI00092A2B0D|nr:hypothetical protein [Singulisphaera sp. GP187]SIN78497.1 hypothetical protein SAMN05444166_0835 [Singulisphaera sp. GP187]
MRVSLMLLLLVAGCSPGQSSTPPTQGSPADASSLSPDSSAAPAPAAVPAPATPPAPDAAPAVAATPIPQDPRRQAQRRRDRLEWNRRTLGGAYDRVGKKAPRWDREARESLEAAALLFTRDLDPRARHKAVLGLAQKAVDKGCDDPMVLYVHGRMSAVGSGDTEEVAQRYVRFADALEKSAYPPFRRAIAQIYAGRIKAARRDGEAAARYFDAALALLPKVVAEDGFDSGRDHNWYGIPWDAFEGHLHATGDATAAFEHVDAALAAIPAMKAERLKLKGRYLIAQAWAARGGGMAETVNDEGWRAMRERLTEARRLLEEAWKLDPGDPRPAWQLIVVNMGLDGDRADMERWFARAMEADGDCKEACEAKMDWLDPKWHGSQEGLLAFGRACRDTKNWWPGIPLLVADAYHRAAQNLPREQQGQFLSPDEVFNDIFSVYEEYLRRYPHIEDERMNYAVYCGYCSRIIDADRQFRELGGRAFGTSKFQEGDVVSIRDYVARWMQRHNAPGANP